jgi:hypothetical protein
VVGALAVLLVGALHVPTAGAAEPAQVRFAHLSPDSPAVDVALAPAPAGGGPLTDPGPDAATALAYGNLSDYRTLAPGGYAVSVRPAGAPADTPPALSARFDVPAGSVRTVALSGLFADLTLEALPDDLSAPPAGSARVRVLGAAAGADPVTMTTAAGATLAEDLPFPGAGRYVAVPAGPAELRLGGAERLSLDLTAGSVVTLVVLDTADGGTEIRPVVDAAGPAVVPAGGVDAGTGPAAVPAAALVALVAGLSLVGRTRGPLLGVAVAVATSLHPPVTDAPTSPRPATLVAPSAAAVPAPVRLRAPAAGIDAAVSAVDVDPSGGLAAPGDPLAAGWFAGGPAPGGLGPAVLAGHVDWGGAPAVFAGLDTLRPGDEVTVERAGGSSVRFTVTRVVRAAKAAFPTAEVYGPTPDAQLRLVTCGGRFDRTTGSYEDNVVVFAQVR